METTERLTTGKNACQVWPEFHRNGRHGQYEKQLWWSGFNFQVVPKIYCFVTSNSVPTPPRLLHRLQMCRWKIKFRVKWRAFVPLDSAWLPVSEYTPDHLLLDSVPNIGPLISRWELDKFKNCLNKRFRTSKILTILYQQFSNLLISQRDMSGPRLGTLSNNMWSGVPIITAEKRTVKPKYAFKDIAFRGPFEIVKF